MCVGYRCLKNALISLNIVYVIVGSILIYSSVSGKLSSPSSDYLPVASGIEICGTFLSCLAIVGIFGALKHHQVVLFFYMIILFFLFLTQIVVSYASMTISDEQLKEIAYKSWTGMDNNTRDHFMRDYHCCNFDKDSLCHDNLSCCTNGVYSDYPCAEELMNLIRYIFKLAGQFGMFFSFTEIIGIWLTKRYRNQKDPRTHLSSAFL